MTEFSRRRFVASLPIAAAGASLLEACAPVHEAAGYEASAARLRRPGVLADADVAARDEEIVRYATLAPSSHNTQCWKFALAPDAITILPDLARRCPAVDPDDHHLYVSLGCATENLVHAALAHGLASEVGSEDPVDGIRVGLSPTRAASSALFQAIPRRQCTRNEYDSQALDRRDIALLERAGTADGVTLRLVSGRPAMERVLDFVLEANTAQMVDAAFVKELKAWIRFNGAEAIRTGDGLYSACTGNPDLPTWLGRKGFEWFFSAADENDKYARQIRSSAGIALSSGASADRAHWVQVGRCYERFALQATVLGIRTAFVNQPVEVASVRPRFAAALGLAERRPDLVVRFGHGPVMPASMRRPVKAVLV